MALDQFKLTNRGIDYANGATSIGNVTYAYDAAGRRTSIGGTLHDGQRGL